MPLSRSLRRLVACAAAVLFLAYQGMAVVHAHSNGAPGSSAGAVPGSCHDTGQQPGNAANSNACQANYQSPNIPSSSSAAAVYAVTDFPAIVARVEPFARVAGSVRPDGLLLHVDPPPLSIVHCCLRN